ncbi:purine/pyrimidine permease [Bacillus sp. 2205SS5-2]|uniref:purine/pyrimidine permease n=1 Tax=Bacillus sp. 2205SS5-2 TaxID=3109031 RepID=UPI003004BA7D
MKQSLGGFQWMAFMIAAAIVAPIAIGDLYGFEGVEKAAFVQRTMFVLGVAGLLQGLIGHRYPINEGPAGLWWGIFVIYAGFAGTIYGSTQEVLQYLQSGMLISGVLFIFLSLFGVIGRLTKLFTPSVTFVYLFLLILQLSGPFMNGMMGISQQNKSVDGVVILASLSLLVLTFYLSNHQIKWIKRYSILFSLGIGWLLFILLGKNPPLAVGKLNWISVPELFVWGTPKWDSGILATGFFITLLLTTNMIASIRIMESVIDNKDNDLLSRSRKGGFVSGVNQLLAGSFSAIGSVPISGAAGFVATTGMRNLFPFLLGSGFVILVSFFPRIMTVLSTLPPAVGYTVTFVIFTKMVAMAFTEWSKESDLDRAYRVAGPALLAGAGAMFVPASAFVGMPAFAVSILNNGLILGTLIAIVIEQGLLVTSRSNKKRSS